MSHRWGLNPIPPPYQGGALPNELRRQERNGLYLGPPFRERGPRMNFISLIPLYSTIFQLYGVGLFITIKVAQGGEGGPAAMSFSCG